MLGDARVFLFTLAVDDVRETRDFLTPLEDPSDTLSITLAYNMKILSAAGVEAYLSPCSLRGELAGTPLSR